MAEEWDDKTEAPTPRKRREAREQGNIARSADLTGAAVIVGMLLLLDWFGKDLMASLRGMIWEGLGDGLRDSSPAGATAGLGRSALATAAVTAPLLGGILVVAVIANVAQVG